MNLAKILEAIIGNAAEIVPAFVHNPKSQKIEAIIFSTAEGIAQLLDGLKPKA